MRRNPPGLSPAWQVAVIAGLTTAAYWVSLRSLASAWRTTTPLAYLGLVPVLGLILLLTRVRPRTGEPAIHDRQVDFLVGVPLLLVPTIAFFQSRSANSTLFWWHRLDLTTLPLFVGGLVAILLGSRTLWRARAPLAFLFLAWPPLSRVLLDGPTRLVTGSTSQILRRILPVLGVTPSQRGGNIILDVGQGLHHTVHLRSSAGTAQTVVGVVLIGLAGSLWLCGRRTSKVAWVIAASLLTWLLSIARIVAVIGIGERRGQLSTWALGPWMQIATLGLAVAGMALLAPRFGLHRSPAQAVPHARESLSRFRRAATAATIGVATLALAWQQGPLQPLSAVANPLGGAELVSFSSPPIVPGTTWQRAEVTPPTWLVLPSHATWERISYRSEPEAVDGAQMTVDIVQAPNSKTLGPKSLRSWYPVHPRVAEHTTPVSLGHGVVGNIVSFRRPNGATWEALTWLWPVAGSGYDHVEQVIVLPPALVSSFNPTTGVADWLSAHDAGTVRQQLRTFGRRIVAAEIGRPAEGTAHPAPEIGVS